MSSFLNKISFITKLKRKTDGVQLLQIQELPSGNLIKLGVTIDWREVNGTIFIDHITGLEPNKKYRIRVLQT